MKYLDFMRWLEEHKQYEEIRTEHTVSVRCEICRKELRIPIWITNHMKEDHPEVLTIYALASD